MKKLLSLSLVASSLLLADTDIEQLKIQMDKQQLVIEKLLQKIEKLENKPVYTKQIAIDVDNKATVTKEEVKNTKKKAPLASKGKTFFQAAYMPDLSLIADMSYVSRSVKDEFLPHLEVPGVAHGLMGSHGHDGNTHSPYNAKEGFNLNYAELGLSKSVDQNLKLDAIFHFSEDAVEIEELYFTTTALGYGMRIKGGKFNSNFGYLNEQHHHYWSFADMPIVYEAFLGMHGINENGAQFQWTAPTETYLMIGAEALQGNNEQMFGNTGVHLEDLNSTNSNVNAVDAPSLFVGYVKSSFDVGDTTVLGGLSYAKGSSRVNHSTEEEDAHVFSGDSVLYGADLTVKHYFDSYSFLTWQSELLSRKMEGTIHDIDNTSKAATASSMTKKQTGLYSQLVYAPNKSWQMGLRYDTIFKNDVIKGGNDTNQPRDLYQYSGMIQYNTSEFARFRLQYNHNSAQYNEDGNKQDVNSLIFQVNLAIGAHGAHSF
ncbi:hypothetical protein N9X61_02195 [Sulfurimonas sp.]|nr:hypothetical protein [Sulfurimonas sp.]